MQLGDEGKVKLTTNAGQTANVQILDITGKIIEELAKGITTPFNTVRQFSLSTAQLHPGVYICRANVDGHILSLKFLIH